MEDYRDEADAAEDLEPESPAPSDEAAEADALEQAADVVAVADDDRDVVGDAPEADALEQRRVVGDADDDERR